MFEYSFKCKKQTEKLCIDNHYQLLKRELYKMFK